MTLFPGAVALRWTGILAGLALVVLGFAWAGSGEVGLALATGGAVLIAAVALVRPREPFGTGEDPSRRIAGEPPAAAGVAPRDAGRRR